MLDAWDVNEGLDMVDRAVVREVNEEVEIGGGFKTWTYVGLLNLSEPPVNKVHLGFVFSIRASGIVKDKTEEHTGGKFFTTKELQQDIKNFEPWSQSLIPHLDGIIALSRGKAV